MCIRDRNYRNELCKLYEMDTNETFIVTQLNDKPLNIVTTFVQSVHPSLAHNHEDGHANRQYTVNDDLVDDVPNVHQTQFEFVNVVHP